MASRGRINTQTLPSILAAPRPTGHGARRLGDNPVETKWIGQRYFVEERVDRHILNPGMLPMFEVSIGRDQARVRDPRDRWISDLVRGRTGELKFTQGCNRGNTSTHASVPPRHLLRMLAIS